MPIQKSARKLEHHDLENVLMKRTRSAAPSIAIVYPDEWTNFRDFTASAVAGRGFDNPRSEKICLKRRIPESTLHSRILSDPHYNTEP